MILYLKGCVGIVANALATVCIYATAAGNTGLNTRVSQLTSYMHTAEHHAAFEAAPHAVLPACQHARCMQKEKAIGFSGIYPPCISPSVACTGSPHVYPSAGYTAASASKWPSGWRCWAPTGHRHRQSSVTAHTRLCLCSDGACTASAAHRRVFTQGADGLRQAPVPVTLLLHFLTLRMRVLALNGDLFVQLARRESAPPTVAPRHLLLSHALVGVT
jgi:hypothetical protein